MKIGNIVSKNKISVSEEFNVVETMDDIIHGLPTLIVGWDFVKKNYPDYNILDHRLSPTLFWTFKKTEKRDIHEEDLIDFIDHCYRDLVSKTQYVFIDPIHFNRQTMRKVLRKIIMAEKIISYKYDDMVYMAIDNIIFGVDFKLLKYMGFNIEKLLQKITARSKRFLVGNEILIEYKSYIERLEGQAKYVPYLNSLTDEKNATASYLHIPRKD